MTKQKTTVFQRICLGAGVGLLVAGIVAVLLWQWRSHVSVQQSESYISTLRTLLPEPQSAVPEARKDNSMPILSIDGTDFAGILEMPRHGATHPVCAHWGRTSQYPCRFSGSIYDRSIQIGATSQKGQFDYYREISVGDQLFFTDMTGNRYAYVVKNIRFERHANQAALTSDESALTLFIKNVYAMEYVLIFCDVAG